MKQASQHFDDDQRRRVNEAVAAAESKTSAEIVPVVATASDRYDRAEDIVGLWLGVFAMIAVWFFMPLDGSAEPGDWAGPSPVWKLVAMVAALVVGFVLGAILADKLPLLRRLFTPLPQMADEVAARARQVFFDSSVHHTAGATGLLIYVSLYEHRAAVLADRAALEKIGQETIDDLCRQLTEALRTGDLTDALCRTIDAAGAKLAPALPRADGDANELPDALVLLDA